MKSSWHVAQKFQTFISQTFASENDGENTLNLLFILLNYNYSPDVIDHITSSEILIQLLKRGYL